MAGKLKCQAGGWVGIDVSKAYFDVALWGDQQPKAMQMNRFRRTDKGVRECAAWLAQQRRLTAGIVMEWTGGHSRELAEWFYALGAGLKVSIVNPLLVKSFGKSFNVRNKTDAVDARLLAQFGQERKPSPWLPPSPEQDQLQSLFRTRQALLGMRTALQNRDGACIHLAPEAERAHANVLTSLRDEIKAIEEAVKQLAKAHPALKRDLDLLQSVKGVGPIASMGVIAELGDLRRFKRGRQLTAFAGVSPKCNESGTIKGKTRMCKVGGAHIRPVLYMAAVSMVRRSGPLGDFYRNLVARGKPEKAALGALMRKVLLVMRAVLIQNKPYQPRQGPAQPSKKPKLTRGAKVLEAIVGPGGPAVASRAAKRKRGRKSTSARAPHGTTP